jgi:hypothetical protein
MNRLIGLYPKAWRARYEEEFGALIAAHPPTNREAIDIVLGAIDARLFPQFGAEPSSEMPLGTRLPGLAAIVGGLLWCGTYLGPALSQGEGEWGGLILLALGFMLLSLPGAYMAAYSKQLGVGVAVVIVSVLAFLGGVLPWGLLLLVPGLTLIAVLGAGTLALAAARAGLSARDRWRMLIAVFAGPVIGAILASAGAFASGNWIPLSVAGAMPYGIAWIAMGALMAFRGAPTFGTPTPTVSAIQDLLS